MKYFILPAISLLLFHCEKPKEQSQNPPNILLIMADDMGYSDLGCYGSEINTPNLDRLASEGMRFTQFYNAARCCPTRASLLTGISPHRAGMGGMVNSSPAEAPHAYQGYLNNQCVTIAEVLRPAGYRTYMSGKWHVGEFRPGFPVDRGFDRYYGLISGAMNYWNITKGKNFTVDRKFVEDTTLINDQVRDGFYSTTAYSAKAVQYLDDHYAHHSDKPFFMYIAHQAPHWPLHAPDSSIAKYRGKYKMGWDELRAQRYARMQEMGLTDADISPLDGATADWESLSEGQKDTMDLKMAIHAAMIDILDQGVGDVIARLESEGQLDNTLIMFLSDNGASPESGAFGRDFRPDLTEAMGSENSYHTFGSSWANAANTPFRKYKRFTYEGGFATPFIVRWGDQITQKDAIVPAVGHIMDVMATAVDVSGASYPDEYKGQAIHPLEGKSLVPVLQGSSDQIREDDDVLVWEHLRSQAVRKGVWKLVRSHEENDWRLYNLANDRTELTDVAVEFPQVKAELEELFFAWAEDVGVKDADRVID